MLIAATLLFLAVVALAGVTAFLIWAALAVNTFAACGSTRTGGRGNAALALVTALLARNAVASILAAIAATVTWLAASRLTTSWLAVIFVTTAVM